MVITFSEWRDRLRHRIRQQLPPGLHYDAEAEEKLKSLLDMEVPSDEELKAMQQRGELRSDEEIARVRRR